MNMKEEVEAIRQRYEKRKLIPESRYDPLNPDFFMTMQEKERAIIRWIKWAGLQPVRDKTVLEVGCGTGVNLLKFILLGFRPENLTGNELLEDSIDEARRVLPEAIELHPGNALELEIPESSFDVVFQSTVFTSILDDEFQDSLAQKMWSWTKPGGGVLWYDFIYNNPSNPDVRGVPLKRVRALFPEGRMKTWRITLAPPLSRFFANNFSASLYTVLNAFPFLRTHVLCWIQKPR